ncbi:MAG: GxxExxY protein [Desulfurivibrio sp.]|nr:GxxExxY protein [Desulfurivibrio sp.]MBU3936899.1 GxxExxY protein [Pseudomonadota bacterium]MBU4034211.1 GxxExxY protein [Pseudomonadota bacterium]MBU4117842.1 GxxExxY protein [Pseudomonadota bacterium]
MREKIVEKDLVYAINACVFEVYRQLGHGFLEKVYENALVREFQAREIAVEAQVPFSVRYKGVIVGEYCADLVVDDKVIVEVKAVERLHPAHEAQILNYLKATGKKIGLLVNFTHPKATVKRFVL